MAAVGAVRGIPPAGIVFVALAGGRSGSLALAGTRSGTLVGDDQFALAEHVTAEA